MVAKCILFLTICMFMSVAVVSHPSKRQVNTDEIQKSEDEERICNPSTPCGWAVYNKFSRYVDYFMKNKCSCATDTECIKDKEDISINAFVYRCKTKES